MKSDNLVPLLTQKNEKAFGYRQGVLLTFDPSTAANTVQVAGGVMTNLPISSASEASVLEAGDVVTILTGGPSWMILGKLIIPETSDAEARLSSLTTQVASVSGIDSFTSTSFAAATTFPGPEVEIYVPKSGAIAITVTAEISGQSSDSAGATAICGGAMSFELSGTNTLAAVRANGVIASNNETVTGAANTVGVTDRASATTVLTGLNPGLTTITAMYAKVGDGTQVNINNRTLSVIAL